MWNMRSSVAANRSLSFMPVAEVAAILDESERDPTKINSNNVTLAAPVQVLNFAWSMTRVREAGGFMMATVTDDIPLPSTLPAARFVVVPVLQSIQARHKGMWRGQAVSSCGHVMSCHVRVMWECLHSGSRDGSSCY